MSGYRILVTGSRSWPIDDLGSLPIHCAIHAAALNLTIAHPMGRDLLLGGADHGAVVCIGIFDGKPMRSFPWFQIRHDHHPPLCSILAIACAFNALLTHEIC